MADEQAPAELTLRIQGADYPFPAFDTLSYKEARRIKKETDGMVMGQFFDALEKGDPDALFAVALIAKLRENPSFNVDEFSDLMLSDIEIVVPEPEPVPPEEAADTPLGESSAESEHGNGDGTAATQPSNDAALSPS